MKFIPTVNQKTCFPFQGKLIFAALFSLLFISLAFFSSCSDEQPESVQNTKNQPGVPVTVVNVVKKDVPLQIDAIGRVEAYSTASIKPQVDGELARIYFEEGEEVKQGELLFEIDTRPFKAALAQAQARMERDKAQMEKAQADARRYAELFEKGVTSKQQYDQAVTDLEALKETVKADQAAVDMAKLELEYCYIHSPIDGRAGKHMVDEGNTVKKRETELTIINQTKPIYVSFSVPEQRLHEIMSYAGQGKKLEVEAVPSGDKNSISTAQPAGEQTDTGNKNYQNPNPVGELTFIDNEVDTTTGTISLKALFPNQKESLWPGQFVNVVMTLAQQQNAVVIPNTAIQKGQKGEYVFVVKPDLTVESRPIVISRRLDTESVVEKGVKPGEKVVTNGQLNLAPGVKVEIQNSQGNETNMTSDASNQGGDNKTPSQSY